MHTKVFHWRAIIGQGLHRKGRTIFQNSARSETGGRRCGRVTSENCFTRLRQESNYDTDTSGNGIHLFCVFVPDGVHSSVIFPRAWCLWCVIGDLIRGMNREASALYDECWWRWMASRKRRFIANRGRYQGSERRTHWSEWQPWKLSVDMRQQKRFQVYEIVAICITKSFV